MERKIFQHKKEFLLENGRALDGIQIAYHTYGNYVPKVSKVIWVCHALTGSSDVFDWWEGLFGEHKLFNPNEYFIVCSNVLGSCYGSTGASSKNEKGEKSYLNFPLVTIRDMVSAQKLLADKLKIYTIDYLVGASLGGQQAIEWSITHPDFIKNQILIATNAKHSAYGIAFNESQRLALKADPTFYHFSEGAGKTGLISARAIAMLSYRSYQGYDFTQTNKDEEFENFKASSYQAYQGEKFIKRFNAHAYFYLTKAMDSHNVGRKRGGVELALERIKAKTLIIGISSDVLFPVEEQKLIQQYVKNSIYKEIESIYGHDGFLVDTDKIEKLIKIFIHPKTEVETEISFKPEFA